MKVVFAGPTLPDAVDIAGDEVAICPPAKQGDIVQNIRRGAKVIGVIDGLFGDVAPIWHKEILFALSQGVAVYGAASMGALRAAECHGYGMIAIGRIAHAYIDGTLEDDSAVGQLHGPEETGYIPLSEPLVNVHATLDRLQADRLLSGSEREYLWRVSNSLFFKELTYARMLDSADNLSADRRRELKVLFRERRVNQKRVDALSLMEAVKKHDLSADRPQQDWVFAENDLWRTRFKLDIRREHQN